MFILSVACACATPAVITAIVNASANRQCVRMNPPGASKSRDYSEWRTIRMRGMRPRMQGVDSLAPQVSRARRGVNDYSTGGRYEYQVSARVDRHDGRADVACNNGER